MRTLETVKGINKMILFNLSKYFSGSISVFDNKVDGKLE
jgi:hypothetical protein